MAESPSPNFNNTKIVSTERGEISSQVTANIEHNLSGSNAISNRPLERSYVFESESNKISNKNDVNMYVEYETSSNTSTDKSETIKAETASTSDNKLDARSIGSNSCEALELNIQEILALDIEYSKKHLPTSSKTTEKIKPKHVFKSLPNLNASSENLLV